MTRWRFAWCWCLGAVLALPALAQEEPIAPPIATAEQSEQSEEQSPPSRWTAGAWCSLRSERPEPADSATEDVGCDAGLGASLIGKDFRQGRLSLVGVLGTKTLGFGGAWTFGRQGSHPLSVALGVVAPYDGGGVYVEEWAVALGATVAVFGRR